MSDEIEIEEHDLLDDPTVRNIFPDISILKQEILDYDYIEAPNLENAETASSQLDSYDDNCRIAESSADGEETKIIVPGDFQQNFQNNGPHNGFIRGDKGINIKICNNKIILGSKPVHADDSKAEHFEKNIKPYCAVVIVEDFGIYLKSSPRYCQHCHILFPTNFDYNNHEKNIHNELVNIDSVDNKNLLGLGNSDGVNMAVQTNKEIEPMSDGNNEYKVQVQQKTTKKLVKIDGETAICLICNTHIKHKRNVKNHLMHVHKIQEEKIGEIMKNKKPGPHPRKELSSAVRRNECFHCKKLFRSQNLLIEHIYSIIQTPKSGSGKYANKILVGNKTNNESSNLLDVPDKPPTNATDAYSKPTISKDMSTKHATRVFKCRFCFQYFKTTKYFLKHMENKHKMVNNFPTAKVSFDPKCAYCPKVNATVDAYNAHLHGYHRRKTLEAIENSRKSVVTSNKGHTNIVPKETFTNIGFYKCGFCCLYFNVLSFFIRHVTIRHKVLKIPKPKKVMFDPKCKYCAGTYPNAKRYNIHLHRVHSAICNKVVDKSTLTTGDERESITVIKGNISKIKQDTEVYRCKFCPIYFKTTKWFIRHLNNKHKIKNIPKMETEEFNPKCPYCPKESDTVPMYNDHLYKSHTVLLNKVQMKSGSAKVNSKKIKFSKPNNSNKRETSKDLIRQGQIHTEGYRCQVCPAIFTSMRYYVKHVKTKHKLGTISKPPKAKLDLKCKYCPSVLTSTKTYNLHIYNRHYTEITRKIHKKDSRLKSKSLPTPKTAVDIKRKRFYRCCYCSYYFNNVTIYISHVKRKHKVNIPHNVKKIEFDPHCKYCSIEAVNILAYNKHLYRCHKNRVNENFTGRSIDRINYRKDRLPKNTSSSSATKSSQESRKSMDDKIANLGSNIIPILKSALFKCHKCDIHFLTIKTALDHANHMELLVNWKCSLCYRIFKDNDRWLHEKQHSLSHVFTVYDLNTANTSHILYKCYKCDLHYDESVDNHHEQCVLKIPQSYTCEICKILIDCNAKICHEYNHKHRHLTSNDFIVIETDVIFDGNTGMMRYDKNKAKIVNTADKMIDDNQGKVGITKPKNKLKRKINNIDNTEVSVQPKKVKKNDASCSFNKSTDIVYNENYSNAVSHNQQSFDKILLKLSFCNTCKSFVSIIGQKRKEHANGLCANLPTQVCKDCGLRFSCKTLSTHRQVHLRIKNLQLENFKFYAFNSGKRAMPPMPEYEKCEICEVNFISKSTLGHHVCSENEYTLCEICNIKLFKPVFNLHMAFHKYKIDTAIATTTSNNAVVCEKKEEINKSNENILLILYCCKVCNLYMDTYDRLIEHCHKHCLDALSKYTEECKICKLKFEDSSLKTHGKVHEKLGVPSFDLVFFDPFYFRFENKVWLNHVFGSHHKIKVQDVILNSRYRNEHRFIMHIVQEGRFDLTLYKCDKCNRYVEPDLIYHHIENSCSNLRKYPCPICHLDFISSFALTRHKSTHDDPKVTLKSYRILNFNRQEDADLNAVIFSPPKLYVLYQCRHCNGIVDSIHRMSHVCDENGLKLCTDCGLLITEDVYEHHNSKHKTLDSYISENMKVILFGEYELHDKKYNSTPISTYRGKIHDYSFYKCRNCHVCVKQKKSTLNHTCCFKGSRVACSKCGLYFNTDKLISHTKSHETDPDFILDNMNIIEYNPTVHKHKDDNLNLINNKNNEECADDIDCVNANENEDEANQESSVSQLNSLPDNTAEINVEVEKITDIYKCSCGLHFIDETSITEHNIQCGSKAKQAKQNCSKCGLLFTPNVLFKHLLSHHGDKLINYKFNIIEKYL